jgi:hypothetical protein
MTVALQMFALAASMVVLGLIVRWGQLRLHASHLAGRIAATLAGIVLFPMLLPLLGGRPMNEVRTYVMGAAFGFAGYWLAFKVLPRATRGRNHPRRR